MAFIVCRSTFWPLTTPWSLTRPLKALKPLLACVISTKLCQLHWESNHWIQINQTEIHTWAYESVTTNVLVLSPRWLAKYCLKCHKKSIYSLEMVGYPFFSCQKHKTGKLESSHRFHIVLVLVSKTVLGNLTSFRCSWKVVPKANKFLLCFPENENRKTKMIPNSPPGIFNSHLER